MPKKFKSIFFNAKDLELYIHKRGENEGTDNKL